MVEGKQNTGQTGKGGSLFKHPSGGGHWSDWFVMEEPINWHCIIQLQQNL